MHGFKLLFDFKPGERQQIINIVELAYLAGNGCS
jgi:hypothetical protein